ncbi:hypothetical protein OBV_29680 [Oscillibacter valericigenes Sjm18-20]|nr:hypothetical protein OBV_29680 [Oscillibacter valericigenes Sjm18-20]
MKKLFSAADRYLQTCDWRDVAVLKFCLCALGVLMGLAVPARKKKFAMRVAALVFVVTYVPLLAKFLPVLFGKEDEK